MRAFPSLLAVLLGIGSALAGSDNGQEAIRSARELELKGDALGARALLQQAARSSTDDAAAVLAYADFLAAHHDPDARPEYAKALAALAPSQKEERREAARRLVLLDLIEGDRTAAAHHLQDYRDAGGEDWAGGLSAEAPATPAQTIEIPGPLRSFSRMAALAPDLPADDLLPALARNVVTSGYQSLSGEVLEPTEYLKLITRYVSQARELARIAGDKRIIRIDACDSAEAGELLRVLGYRMRGGCGSDVVLETVNAGRAFVTIDSGFPIAELEQALRTNRKFEYAYAPTRVPILYDSAYWAPPTDKQSADFIDALLGDPILCRTYLGLAKLNRETADAVRQAGPIDRLKAFAHVLDFYGGMFEVRAGKAVTPGGARAEPVWAELVGVPPAQGGAFFVKLISKDDGWMASYFDALARIDGPVKDYLADPQRLKRFYQAVHGRVTSPGPARPVFRANTDMLLLTTRLRLDPDGQPHVPGGLAVWKNLFAGHVFAKLDLRLSRAAPGWKTPDDLMEALFGLCRKSVDNQPLAVFMTLSDLDRLRPKALEPATVERLAADYRIYGSQYSLFAEAPQLSEQTMLKYLDTARALNHGGDTQLRLDLTASMQALAGLWQIFCRQGFLPPASVDATLAGMLAPFPQARSQHDLFDGARAGVGILLKATGAPEGASAQDWMLGLLAGAQTTDDSETQARVIQDMVRILEAQRLVSLDNLFALADNLDAVARGEKINSALVNRLAARIAEIQPPWTSFTIQERGSMTVGYTVERHIEIEHHLNLKSAIDRAQGDAARMRDLRGTLAPFLRDTLVGLNYVHYAPPGAQVLLTNPSFVRGHDVAGSPGHPLYWDATWVASGGWPTNSGGRLTGSLAGLPYALAVAEQNFMVPVREQALIWGDLAPQLIQSAKISRWWNVTPAELHWVELHLRYAESLVAESVLDPDLRRQLTAVLGQQAPPARAAKVAELVEHGEVRAALDNITPDESFLIAHRMIAGGHGLRPLAADIGSIEREAPGSINYQAVSLAFGTPKPTLTGSYRPELLHLRTFPALMGYSSRILAESWESTNLYWAALADEIHASPSQLNVLIPEWTQQAVEQIFATHLEDWPAVFRSLRHVGEDVRAKARLRMDSEQKASLQ
jgi:hypothetical protein